MLLQEGSSNTVNTSSAGVQYFTASISNYDLIDCALYKVNTIYNVFESETLP